MMKKRNNMKKVDFILADVNTVKDEDIKDDALNLVNNLNHVMSNIIDTAKEKVSEVLNLNSLEEE